MKRDLLKVGYTEFVIPMDFDLNQLRGFDEVEHKGEVYVGKNNIIKIELNIDFESDPQEVEKVSAEYEKGQANQYREWWMDNNKKVDELQKEVDCYKQRIEEMKKENTP